MPSRRDRSVSYSRSRSRSPDRHRDRERRRERDRDRSYSPDERRKLPHDASPITESDYFQKSDEFRVWLKDEKGKYFDELSGDRARSYFRKFVKAWNRGKLSKSLYAGIDSSSIPATSTTSYKWSFASKSSRADEEALKHARESVGAATHNRSEPSYSSSGSKAGSGRMQGPTLPSAADMQLARETAAELAEEERRYKRKRDRKDEKDRIEDIVGPKEVGREGMLEKKRARRENDRAFREKGDEGLEADETTLMGGGDSFQAHIARRDAAKKRHEHTREDKANTMRERANALKEKESATMAMFQQLAKQRFG
ncbi:splicing arginine serine-rich 12 [Moniliophthora roreri MCA 2997]|uniref:Splicing arginine serine-rich 12 n=1 Tax=Moniliophthora roreri (strain MCA 2997) TaxID=1381753 RepID=V2WAX8_MONRO|nr:splicing arginine serine-rich 12 [Moniliophthora roreri MCA 2997]